MDQTAGAITVQFLITFFSAGGFSALTTYLMTRQRNKMEKPKLDAEAENIQINTADQLNKAALNLIEPYREEVNRLQGEVIELRGEVKKLKTEMDGKTEQLEIVRRERDEACEGARRLWHQVILLGGVPVYKPAGVELSQPDKPEMSSG